MPVPTYTLLTAAQLAPGKPMAQEIALALWRNPLALLNVDETDSNPSPGFPRGYFKRLALVTLNETKSGANGAAGPATTALSVADSTKSVYDFRISPPYIAGGNSGKLRHIEVGDTISALYSEYMVTHLGGEWGATDYVRMCAVRVSDAGSYGMPTTIDATAEVGAAWANLATARSGNDQWQWRAVASGNELTVEFRAYRIDNPAGAMRVVIDLAAVRQNISTAF